jgi:hypothetical protein
MHGNQTRYDFQDSAFTVSHQTREITYILRFLEKNLTHLRACYRLLSVPLKSPIGKTTVSHNLPDCPACKTNTLLVVDNCDDIRLRCSMCYLLIYVKSGQTIKEAIYEMEQNVKINKQIINNGVIFKKRFMKPKPIIIPNLDGTFDAIVIITDGEPKKLGTFSTIDKASDAIKEYTRFRPRILRRKRVTLPKTDWIAIGRAKLKAELQKHKRKNPNV